MAASPAPTRYFTYKPGQGGSKLVLKPGQTLGYKFGSGYYAKDGGGGGAPPAGGGFTGVTDVSSGGGYAPNSRARTTPPPRTPPPPPVDPYAASTPGAVDKRAAGIAQGDIDAQSAEVRRQQALAAEQARNDEAAITGFSKAAGDLEAQMPGQINDAYHQAVGDVGALGQGISGQVGHDLSAAQAQDDAFAASQGQSGGHTDNVPDVQTTLQMLNGVIPGSELAARGAAEATWAAKQPQISLDAGRQQLDARMAQAHKDGDGYAQQLITIAATYPQLKAQALTQLNQYELDKANYRLSRDNAAADNARQDRALSDQEKAAGISAATDVAKTNAEYAYKYAALRFRSQADAQKAAQKAALLHKQIDAAASRALGHVVYKDGTQDPSIKVAQSAGGASSAAGKAATAKIYAKKTAVTTALSLRGKPQLAPHASAGSLGPHGKYLAGKQWPRMRADSNGVPLPGKNPPGAVFPDGTTNNPRRAAYSGDQYTYQQAQNLIFEKIGGQTLMARYNLSREQVMAWINAALAGAGWSK